EERRVRLARAAAGRDPAEVPLDEVRVVRRAGGENEDLPGGRLERDRGGALPGEELVREPLGARVDRRVQVVPLDRDALEAVEGGVQDRREVRVRAGQVVVVRALQAGLRAALSRVADDLRRERAGRVAAEVERPAVDALADVRREQRVP